MWLSDRFLVWHGQGLGFDAQNRKKSNFLKSMKNKEAGQEILLSGSELSGMCEVLD